MQSLYNNPRIKALVNLSHGEGFGLPMFDAACHGLPVIAPSWSGHCDFLHMPLKNGKILLSGRGLSKKTACGVILMRDTIR